MVFLPLHEIPVETLIRLFKVYICFDNSSFYFQVVLCCCIFGCCARVYICKKKVEDVKNEDNIVQVKPALEEDWNDLVGHSAES